MSYKKLSEGDLMDARWSEHAEALWGGYDLLVETGYLSYDGYVEFVAKHPAEDKWIVGEWSYGSCSGCDSWEELSDEDCLNEMRSCATAFHDLASLEVYMKWARTDVAKYWPDRQEGVTLSRVGED